MELDHFIGRSVEKVEDGAKEGEWTITLSGNATIWNLDPAREKPQGLEGTIFCRADTTGAEPLLSFCQGTEADGSAKVVSEIALNPDLYGIGMAEIQPPQPTPAEELPDDPSPERVVDGPEASVTPQEAEDGSGEG